MDKLYGINQAMERIYVAFDDAEKKHPTYPTDIVYRAAILAEETGEVVRAAWDLHVGTVNNLSLTQTERHREELKKELAQTGAMAMRMLAAMITEER